MNNVLRGLLIAFGVTLLGITVGYFIFQPKPAHGQDTGNYKLCNPETARKFSNDELKDMKLDGKVLAYKDDLSPILKAPSVTVVVVACDNPDDVVVRRTFDENGKTPVLLSATIYVPLPELRRHNATHRP